MKKQQWLKWFMRSIAAILLWIGAGVFVSFLSPVVSPMQEMQFMMGMMGAMHGSLMASMMGIAAEDGWINFMFSFFSLALLLAVPLGIGIGWALRKRGMVHEKE